MDDESSGDPGFIPDEHCRTVLHFVASGFIPDGLEWLSSSSMNEGAAYYGCNAGTAPDEKITERPR